MHTYLLTHTDLDGVGAAVLAKRTIPNLVSISYVDYDNIDTQLQILLNQKDVTKNDLLLITDISPSLGAAQVLAKHANENLMVKLFDHHDSRSWIADFPWATYDVTKCGTSLFYNEVCQLDPQMAAYKDFADSIEAWDIWKLDDPHRARGERLHTLHKFIGTEEFLRIFVEDCNADMNEPFVSMLRYIEAKKSKVIKSVLAATLESPLIRIDSLGRTFMIVFATDYVSEIAHELLDHPDYDDLKFVAVYNPIFETCSLRSRDNETDVSYIAKKLNGGGHKQASGYPYYSKRGIEENIFKMINTIEY
jgi:oligoribonuclease NrnB/cAMP/cGMP phosphodiesterase (DHH superfamily)